MRSPNEESFREKQQSQRPVLARQQSRISRDNDRQNRTRQPRAKHETPKYLVDEAEWIRQFGY
jgi:hypothetical protein